MINKTYLKTKDYCKVIFSIAPGSASSVDILGLNNDWDTPVGMRRQKDLGFRATVRLPKDSIHEFKYLFDNAHWGTDPSADGEVPNPFGTTNSILSI